MTVDLQADARRIYFEARRRGAFHLQSLRAVSPVIEQNLKKIRADHEHGIPRSEEDLGTVPPTFAEVERWAVEEAWDAQFQALQSSDFRDNLRAPEDEEDRFRLRLDASSRNREIAGDALRLVQAEMDHDNFTITDAFLIKMASAQRLYSSALREESKAEDDARKRLLEIPSGPAAAADIEARKQKLMAEYGGKGPQYEIMCSRVAELDYRAEVARTSGRDLPTSELVSLNDSIIRSIGQLQKYSESTKSESLSKDRTELGIAIMSIVEKIVAPTQPNLWAAVFVGVKQHLQMQDRRETALGTVQPPENVVSLLQRADGSFGLDEG